MKLESALLACFVGGFVYVLAVILFVTDYHPFAANRAIGVNGLIATARSPEMILIGLVAFVLSFWALKRWVFVKH